ncbi:translation initiation factor IF-3 [Agrococcus casei]|uniref:Translation initiation factor IF-3 n=1 Tax=Agrococcus casei LMG 22410 TaxID=1255656 RepID=A0A1R4GJC5_9MICO|nr:translation initiation factor IF-3 [Agrococcus casei]SJM68185.1 Translation initiation factor 3 [Agrococcus casei LMG 22410]
MVDAPLCFVPSRFKEHAISDDHRINERIRVPEVRLVGPSGEQVGVVAVDVALRLAREASLDLVEVAPGSRPPVAKIMDFGKFKYEQAQKAKEARRNQANTVLKEVRFRLKIDEHDYETKRRRAEGFLQAGDKVKAMILFRGREQSRPEMGVKLLQRFAEDVAEFGAAETRPTIDGRNMTMIVGPLRSKSDARAEINEARKVQRNRQQEKRREAAENKAAHQAEAEAERAKRPAAKVDATFDVKRNQTTASAAAKVASARPAAEKKPSTAPAAAAEKKSSAASAPKSASAPAAKKPAAAAAPKSTATTGQKPAPAAAEKKPRAAADSKSAAAPVKPVAKATPKPAAKPAGGSTPKPVAKPADRPAAKPSAKPASPKPKPSSGDSQ